MILETETNSEGKPDGVNSVWRLAETVSIHDIGESQYAVRDLRTKTYFRVGEQEAFLLGELLPGTSYDQLKDRFFDKFGEPLEFSDFDEFLKTLADRGLLREPRRHAVSMTGTQQLSKVEDGEEPVNPNGGGRSLLYYRVPLVNPNRFLSWFVNAFPLFWTKSFLAVTISMMLFSLFILLTNSADLVTGFRNAIRWESFAIALVAIVSATIIHELGHGATCKRFGGEVTEAGFLIMFFLPCLYVNVSDAWVIREKWKRLAITLAGGYCDLCIWAISVLIWRITELDSSINYVALVLLTTCGSRSLMNFNPLLRLDGYYLLSDILEYPNLYKQSRQYWIGALNWLLWGAKKPIAPRMPIFTMGYGMMMWLFGLCLLGVVGWRMLGIARLEYGIFGIVSIGCLLAYGVRRVFRGLIGEEFVAMIKKRTIRTAAIAALWIGACAASFIIPMEYTSTGNFEVRPASDIDVCSPVHSFIATVCVQDGQMVECDQPIVELHAPDLVSMLAAKAAEELNAQATLSKLEAGPRPEEIRSLERKVVELKHWCTLGATDLDASKKSLEYDLLSLKEKSNQIRLQIELAEKVLQKTEELRAKGAVAGAQIVVEKSQLEVLKSQLVELENKRSSVESEGVNKATGELAQRKRQLSDAESELLLLRLGTRKEEVDAARARVTMLKEEIRFLKEQQSKLMVRATASGVVSAPRLREKVGQFMPKGMPICRIEMPGKPFLELMIPEAEAVRIEKGQKVRLKAKSLPFETISATVERIAPAASKPPESTAELLHQTTPSMQSLAVYCSLDGNENRLRSGMTGVGRVSCGRKSLGEIAMTQILQYVRTEFWW
jgi:putative peptide zinc metalloprotease protein